MLAAVPAAFTRHPLPRAPRPPVSHCAALLAIGFALALSGCSESSANNVTANLGIPATNSTVCSVSAASTTSSGAAPSITPAATALTMYPGQTLSLPVAIAPAATGSAAQTVALGISNLPPGLAVQETLTRTGATASLRLIASTTIASNCFTGTTDGVDSVTVPLTLEAKSNTGDVQMPLALTVSLENPAFTPSQTDLPVLSITTTGAAPITSTDTYVPATVNLADTANPALTYAGAAEIKGHGNSTWLMPKKPYKIKLAADAPLLGMKPAKDWILLANYDDKSMLRTSLAFHISQILGLFWTPSTQFAELYLNGSYQGTYQVSEEVEIDPNRLDIAEVSTSSNSGNALTGGYLLEIDNYANETFMTTSPRGLPIGSQDPNPPTPAQEAYLTATIAAAENALYSPTFTNPGNGWPAFFDESSLVDWYLVEELTDNYDARFWSSVFFYKLKGDPHFYMGPVWDFDVSAGNVFVAQAADPAFAWVRTQAPWYQQLFTDPAFLAAVRARWTAIRPQLNDLPSFLNTQAGALATAEANNYARWPTLGQKVWPNPEAAGSYQGEVDALSNWTTQRLAYMDSLYLIH